MKKITALLAGLTCLITTAQPTQAIAQPVPAAAQPAAPEKLTAARPAAPQHTAALAAAPQTAARYPLIPWPSSLTPHAGNFTIDRHTGLVAETAGSKYAYELSYLQTTLRRYLGSDALQPAKTAAKNIIVRDDVGLTAPEAYRITITTKTITLAAHSPAGMFYAIQTLRQLMPPAVENSHGSRLEIPCVDIADQPAFPWRGMMLDVSRHFFSTAYLRKFIDMMALYKYNKLHLHLTDDQGWRIEIKKYPLLTTHSGWRTLNDQDSACMKLAEQTDNPDFKLDPAHIKTVDGKTEYGGFYTQEEMKAIIRYAATRHIEIIPEIDMPGHMMAAILLYPDLTCEGKKGADWRQGFTTPICPCKESTLQFAKDIFTEIAALFPSKYIHIGGDEVDKSAWQKSLLCRGFMQDHHLTTFDQLQTWFNNYMEDFFHTKGKTLVGWDEIVDGGIDSAATVMYWRTWAKQAPLKTTRNGNKLIMTADGPLYFDAWPDRHSLSAVYHYNPTDPMYGMNPEEEKNVIGVQANLWTERVPTEARADYLLMPRMTALAELGWTHRDLYDSYKQRLEEQYDRLDRLNIHYRLPDLPELSERRVFIDTAMFFINPPTPGLTIRYAEDGFPTMASPILDHPLLIDHSRELKVAAFTAAGRRGDVATISFDHQTYAPAMTRAALAPGLTVGLFRGEFQTTAAIHGSPDSSMILPNAALPSSHPDAYALQFRGYIDVPATGIYSFFLTSDDGSVLRIADRLVVDNDGAHSSKEKSGQIALQKGLHEIALDYMDLGGGGALELSYSKDNETPQPVPASWFFSAPHPANASMQAPKSAVTAAPHIVNIINFIRLLEPRDSAITEDVLYQTVAHQIKMMQQYHLGGTFLLQYDALMNPRYQQLLKTLDSNFEIGGWWEITQPHVERAGLRWRGRYPWDWDANVDFSTGYTEEERRKLVDVYFEDFKNIFGHYPASVGSWFIDSYTLDYMYKKYGITATCNCKDQIGTDGYTLWGGYWNQAYYPSLKNAYMPAQDEAAQLPVPVFRMLGSDPIRQYESGLGSNGQGVVTLEPVYPFGGGDSAWVHWYFDQFTHGACMAYAYVQAGQENSFTWPAMSQGLGIQLPLIAKLRDSGLLQTQTLGRSGRWFKEQFKVTPATSVTVNKDLDTDQKTIWFDSRFFRLSILWDNQTLRIRDLHLFDENISDNIKKDAATGSYALLTLPFVDGFVWSDKTHLAGLRLKAIVDGKEQDLTGGGDPVITDSIPGKLHITWPLKTTNATLTIDIDEKHLSMHMEGEAPNAWFLELTTAAKASLPFRAIERHDIRASFHGTDYTVHAIRGIFEKPGNGAALKITPEQQSIDIEL